MSIEPLTGLTPALYIHISGALLALGLGPLVLWRKRRDALHKRLGYVWVLAMGLTALSGFAIPSHFTAIGLGPIHLLSAYALSGLYVAMRAILRRDVATHSQVMQNLYVRGVGLAGAFNFLPGRTMQRAMIPDVPELGYVLIGAALVWAFVWPVVKQRRRRLV